MFPGTATGGNFTVNASLSSTDGAFHTVSASDEDNSLFAEGSGGDTAIVKNLRHLQNLSAGFSARQKTRQLIRVVLDASPARAAALTQTATSPPPMPLAWWES